MEYDPEPPFNIITPETAGPEMTGLALTIMEDMNPEAVEIARSRRREQIAA